MIAIEYKATHEIMNDRQSSDFPKESQMLLDQFRTQRKQTRNQSEKDALSAHIERLENEKSKYYAERIKRFCTWAGGQSGEYGIIPIPPEEENDFLRARYITYDGQKLTYLHGKKYRVEGSKIIISPGWIAGNYRLETEDITDFVNLELSESLRFRFSFFRKGDKVSIRIFLAKESEDFTSPDIPGMIFLSHICYGIITPTHQIIIGGGE